MSAAAAAIVLERLSVLLTSRCDWRCGYCFRRAQPGSDASWPDVRRTLDWALSLAGPRFEVVFSGGEPLLAPEMLRRSLAHLTAARMPRRQLGLRLLTNGSRLDPPAMELLERHEVHVQLSHDGVPDAQRHRRPGAPGDGDALLHRLRRFSEDLWRNRLSVAVTVHPGNVALLSASVRHLLDHDVRQIHLSPALTPSPGWDAGAEVELRAQFAEIAALSLDHWRRMGQVPVRLLRRYEPDISTPRKAGIACNAVTGVAPALAPDGRLSACALLAGSHARLPRRWRNRVMAAALWGRVDDPEFALRRAASAGALAALPPLSSPDRRRSVWGSCRACDVRAECQICPYAIMWVAPGDDALVPGFVCAFVRAAVGSRRSFPAQTPPVELLCQPAMLERQRLAWLAAVGRRPAVS